MLPLELAFGLVDGVIDVGQAQLVLLADYLAHFLEIRGVFMLLDLH